MAVAPLMFRPLRLAGSNDVYFARYVTVEESGVAAKYSLVVTDLVTAWIEECQPRKLGTGLQAKPKDQLDLFRKLFQYGEGITESKPTNLEPKFTLTPSPDQFSSYTLSVRFKCDKLHIAYDFRLEPIPSPQEYIRDHVIKPLLFTTLCLSRHLEDLKTNPRPKVDFSRLTDENSREVRLIARNPYAPINGIGASMLELYHKLQLNQNKYDAAPELEISFDEEFPSVSASLNTASQPMAPSQQLANAIKEKKLREKETWNLDPGALDDTGNLDLHYDSGAVGSASVPSSTGSASLERATLGIHGNASQTASSSSSQHSGTFPSSMGSSSIDRELELQNELAAAAEIEERLAKKKRKRETREAMESSKKRFL